MLLVSTADCISVKRNLDFSFFITLDCQHRRIRCLRVDTLFRLPVPTGMHAKAPFSAVITGSEPERSFALSQRLTFYCKEHFACYGAESIKQFGAGLFLFILFFWIFNFTKTNTWKNQSGLRVVTFVTPLFCFSPAMPRQVSRCYLLLAAFGRGWGKVWKDAALTD